MQAEQVRRNAAVTRKRYHVRGQFGCGRAVLLRTDGQRFTLRRRQACPSDRLVQLHRLLEHALPTSLAVEHHDMM